MINYRALIITGVLLLFVVLLTAKLFTIQVTKHEFYTLLADRQQNKSDIIKAERGIIKDINGEVLSFTRDNVSFYVDRRMMNDRRVDTIVTLFSKVFNKPQEYYRKLIDGGIANILIEKKVPMDLAVKIKQRPVDGLFYKEDFTRIYPYGSLASHLLGFVNRGMAGVEGIEKYYDNFLTGIDGSYTYQRDVLGRTMSIDEKNSYSSTPGNNVILTINKSYQKILEEELQAGIQKFGGQSAVGIIMNPNNGEVFAIANMPDFDPANTGIYKPDNRRNRALTDSYEPGSTMKPIIMSIMLDQNLAKEYDLINTENGSFIYEGRKIVDSHPHQTLTVKQIIEYSSDIGMVKLTKDLNNEVMYKYLRDFGFSSKTLIDLPGETDGSLKNPKLFSVYTKASISFGYEISVTPLQMTAAYSALVNGGNLYQPYVVKKITDQNDKVVEEFQPRFVRKVVNNSTSDKIRDFMVGVVENGTALQAQLPNVWVGGKTGTAEISEGGSYNKDLNNSSFIGFFPADKPNVVCLILVTAPKKVHFGGEVAAPIFQNVAKRILEADFKLAPVRVKIERKQKLMNDLITYIQTLPSVKSITFANVGDRSFEYNNYRNFSNDKTIMPDLINQSMRDAMAQLSEIGMRFKIIGSGKVVWQSLEPGAGINQDSVCILKCEPLIKKINRK
jgi:cell division protein FtsI/penicillin-binding protein 2